MMVRRSATRQLLRLRAGSRLTSLVQYVASYSVHMELKSSGYRRLPPNNLRIKLQVEGSGEAGCVVDCSGHGGTERYGSVLGTRALEKCRCKGMIEDVDEDSADGF